MTSRIVCLSHILESSTPSYGNRDKLKIRNNSSLDSGDMANTSSWEFSINHLGTHVDVPFHFDSDGKKTTDFLPEEWFFHKIALVDMPCSTARLISDADLKNQDISPDTDLLLIRTGYESFRSDPKYYNDNPGIAPGMAEFLRENFHCMRGIGFDFISLSSWTYRKEGRQAHKEFLAPPERLSPILIFEDMSLASIKNPIKWVAAAPLLVEDGNGGPVTVFAKEEGQ